MRLLFFVYLALMQPQPLFGFRLRPLSQLIQSWEIAQSDVGKYLSGWFWLTGGWYWISTPAGDVPLSHPEFDKAFQLPADSDPHLDYQVARLWIDLEAMLASVLEPAPDELAEVMASGKWHEWRAQIANWVNALPADDERADRKIWSTAFAWSDARTLDMAYLAAPPEIMFWCSEEAVTLSWDTHESYVDGVQCWVETQGNMRLSVAQFSAQIESLRLLLDTEMRQRMREVMELGLLDAATLIDLERQQQLTLFGKKIPLKNNGYGSVFDAIQNIRQLQEWSGLHLLN